MSISGAAAKPQRACHASKAPKASMVTAATYMLLSGSTVQAQDSQIAPANEGKSVSI